MNICPQCRMNQFSLVDQKYLEIFGVCWSCDKRSWEAGNLSLADFESRESQAFDAIALLGKEG